MNTYVLIHGAWFGGWCWSKLTPLLEQAGHRTVTFDLPAHGEDSSPVSSASLQSYTDRVAQVLEQQPEPVILVAHSMGGVVASQVAERHPERIQTLVYVSAYLLRESESLHQIVGSDREAKLGTYLVVNEPQGTLGIREEGLKEALFADCPDEDVSRAKAQYRDEPLAPLATPVSVSTERFGRVPRVYIQTLQDRVVSPTAQKQMYTASPCQQVFSLETGHLPFFAAPDKLAAHLLSLSSKVR
jgi:pimeloyl-ACP methyl ester carboxylesterase